MKEFKIAQIVPVPHLEQIKDNHYHMCLAHLVGQNAKYSEFYRCMSDADKFVLMDNGAAEGAQLPVGKLLEMLRNLETPIELMRGSLSMTSTHAHHSSKSLP